MNALLVIGCALIGLLIGSFLNVVIWRVPRGESIISPPSHCPCCDAQIRSRDNVPVVSWLLLRGRCRQCGARISARYPAVELLTAAVFAAFAWRIGVQLDRSVALAAYLVFGAVGVAQAGIDIDTKRLPFKITGIAYGTGVAVLAATAAVTGDVWPFYRALIGMGALYAFYEVIAFVQPRGMGGGDVVLSGALGLYTAWLGWSSLVVCAFMGFFVGGLVGIGLMLFGGAGRKTKIPFGPYMLLGALIAVMVGQEIGAAYLSVTFG